MFGFKHIKFDAMTYVMHYKNGKIAKEGRGLSFFYFVPSSSIVAIPMGSNDLPFVFNESTDDYQSITIQGQISYKIDNPKKLADNLDFTVNDQGLYKKNDIEKLHQRIINETQTAISSLLQQFKLKEVIKATEQINETILKIIGTSLLIDTLGIDILGANILAIKATPEMARALETSTRERLQQEADHAIYERRNFAVEQERRIKETELNTEIALEEKQKQITEKKMERNVMDAENSRKLREMQLVSDIKIETERKKLVEQKNINDKALAETKSFVLQSTLQPYKEMDWKVLMALTNTGDAKNNIAIAFRELAENADKIGTLNITPDLLESITNTKTKR